MTLEGLIILIGYINIWRCSYTAMNLKHSSLSILSH